MWRIILAVWIVWVGATPIALAETPPVLSVHPSGTSIAENLLRISIVFASAVQKPVLPQIVLQRSDSTVIKAPFLEQELWSPDGKTLTLLLHPGRVKTGLIAHDKLGRAIVSDVPITLVVDHHVVKHWSVKGEDRIAPNPTQWTFIVPKSGTMEALQIAFEAPIDALSSQRIAVVSPSHTKVDGKTALTMSEGHWIFSPSAAWRRGTYHIFVHPRLEDPSGNAVHEPFEHTISSTDTVGHSAIDIPILIN